jgi:hypothetical protein
MPVELDELAQTRLIVLALALAGLAVWATSRAAARRRERRFAALAESLGGEVLREGPSLARFLVEVDGREIEVRHHHQGRAAGTNWSPGWQMITVVPLRGVSELHSARIGPRWGRRPPESLDPRDDAFADHFTVRDFGMPLREGWLGGRARAAIAHFYALDLPLAPLDLEEGRLLHRGDERLLRLDGTRMRELLERQVAVGVALERGL